MAGCGEVAVHPNRAKGGSIPSIGVVGEPKGLMLMTKRHSGVRTTAKHVAELQRWHGYGELGQGRGFSFNR